MPQSTICPACGQEAPIVYRGVVPHCTACGALRAPLSSASVNLAGKPSRFGSTFATVFGWIVLLGGGSATLGVVLLALALGWTPVALGLGVPMALFSLIVGVLLVRKGGSLAASADASERGALTQALLSLAAHRGAITARDAAKALGVGVAKADAMLTDLAKKEPERVGVDIDDQGNVWYRVAAAPGEPLPRVRVGAGVGVGVRVGEDEAEAIVDSSVDAEADAPGKRTPGKHSVTR
jgi:hypothetical protein